jgi:hypothetical protein
VQPVEARERKPVLTWSHEEIFALSHIDETWHQDARAHRHSIRDDEMRCQHDMSVRGRRLWAYHLKIGDLIDFLPA